MEQNLGGQHSLRPAIIFMACFDIFYSCFQLSLGIHTRKSSFAFNTKSLEGRNEGPEAELNITVPSRSVMDFVSIVVAILLLVGVTQRKVYPVCVWIYYTILRLGLEMFVITICSPPSTTVRLMWWLCYAAIAIFMMFNLGEILNETPTPSESLLQGEDNRPTYEDVVPSCVEIQSQVQCRHYASPPPYSHCV